MSLLSQLLENDVHTATAATPATPATQTPKSSKGSKSSKGANGEKETHARLLALAEAEALPPELVHQLPAADLRDCAGLPDAALIAYLHCLDDAATREAGKKPLSYTAKAMCRHCGPVWLSPDVADVLPVVAGWPQALGCPWCHVTPPAGMAIPRPKYGDLGHSHDHERHGG